MNANKSSNVSYMITKVWTHEISFGENHFKQIYKLFKIYISANHTLSITSDIIKNLNIRCLLYIPNVLKNIVGFVKTLGMLLNWITPAYIYNHVYVVLHLYTRTKVKIFHRLSCTIWPWPLQFLITIINSKTAILIYIQCHNGSDWIHTAIWSQFWSYMCAISNRYWPSTENT